MLTKCKTFNENHWWLLPFLVFCISRMVTVGYYLLGVLYGNASRCGTIKCANYTYFDLSATWDSWWYMITAANGYPDEINRLADGSYDQSPWAFFPMWSWVLRLGNKLTGLDYYHFGSLAAIALSLAAVLVAYRWLRTRYPSSPYAYILLAWLCLSPLTLVFHLNYPEPLALLLLVTTLWLVDAKRLLWACLPILMLGLTRPIAGAFVLMFLFLAYGAQKTRPLALKYLAMAFVSGVSFGIWPLVTAIKFGSWDSYLKVQQAWLMYGEGSYFKFMVENPGQWAINGVLILAVGSILISIFWKSDVPRIIKIWSTSYLIFLLFTVHVAFNQLNHVWTLPSDGGTPWFNTSLIRYGLMLLVPFIPLQFIPRSGLKRKITIGLLLLASLLLTIPYVMIYTASGPLFGFA